MASRRTIERAVELQRAGKVAEAAALIQQSLRLRDDPDLQAFLGGLLISQGRLPQAEYALRRAAQAQPRNPMVLVNLGATLALQSKHEEALVPLRQAIAVGPMNEDARLNLITSIEAIGRLVEAVGEARAGLAVLPGSAGLHAAHARVLHGMGRVEEAMGAMRRARELAPLDIGVADQLCSLVTYGDVAPEEAFKVFSEFGYLAERLAATVAPLPRAVAERRSGPLRVGLISPDLRRHAVAMFIEPFLEHADRSRITIHCYSAAPKEDDVSARLRAHADGWRRVDAIPDPEVARLIREDGIDVLIDLAGHTQGNRLMVLALRPAPVQLTYLGFPSTTGLHGVGWRVTSSITDPPGTESHSSERLARMDPCQLTYKPVEPLPSVSEAPMLAGGAVTFGSYSSLQKLSQPLIDAWAGILRGVPGSRLILKHGGLRDEGVRREVMGRLEGAGAPAASVVCEPPEPTIHEVLPQYNRIDIALDTFPFNGATTTCDALVMGVPVVTLRGRTTAGRVAATLLSAMGLDELIADDAGSYQRIAVELATNADRLGRVRQGLRERFLGSEITDARGGAARLTDVVCRAWASALAGEPGSTAATVLSPPTSPR